MRIGLINIEPRIFNTAYMQIAAYHKSRGDSIDWWSPLTDRQFDHIYCSSLFDFTDKSEVPQRAICGGTGFDISSRLSITIENCDLDYSIYPQCRVSYLWFSRGCNHNCPWCVVPEKEGRIYPVEGKNLNPKTERIVVCDNSFFENPQWYDSFDYLRFLKIPVDFQGIDVRTITGSQASLLTELRHARQIKIAWDSPRDHKKVLAGIKRMIKHISPYRLMCYVLVDYPGNSTEQEDLYRVKKLRELNIDPFVMPYDKNDLYQRSFARWVNHKAIFKKVPWNEYKGRVEKQEAAGTGWKY